MSDPDVRATTVAGVGSEPTPSMLDIVNVRKYYKLAGNAPWARTRGWVRAVDGVSLAIRHGETLSLVGESGSGKTTLARLMLRLERPDSGHMLANGRDVHTLAGPPLRSYQRRVSAVFQNPWSSLNPRMRVSEAIAEPLKIDGALERTEIRARVRALITSVGLDPDQGGRFPHEFSGGERQRIALARALALSPELIVLDEPVSALDVSVRAQIMNLLKDLQEQRGLGYFVVAHNLSTVRYLGDRVAVMYLGQVVENGPAESLFKGASHPYTRALVSAALPQDQTGSGIILSRDIPSPTKPPPGCRFHTRCWLYDDLGKPEVCRSSIPELATVGPDHEAACHFAEDTRASPLGRADYSGVHTGSGFEQSKGVSAAS